MVSFLWFSVGVGLLHAPAARGVRNNPLRLTVAPGHIEDQYWLRFKLLASLVSQFTKALNTATRSVTAWLADAALIAPVSTDMETLQGIFPFLLRDVLGLARLLLFRRYVMAICFAVRADHRCS